MSSADLALVGVETPWAHLSRDRSAHFEDHLAGGAATFQGGVGCGGVGEGEAGTDADVQRPGSDGGEEFVGPAVELIVGGDVVAQGGASDEQRTAGAQALQVERRYCPLEPPNSTSVPRGRRLARDASKVDLPTPS